MTSHPFRFDPFDHAVQADPYPAYRRLRDEYPVYRVGEHAFWVLSRYDDVKQALMSPEVYSSAQGNLIDDSPARVGRTLGTTDPPRHTELRRLINKVFTPRRVKDLEPSIREISSHLLDELAGSDGEVDLVERYVAPLSAGVIGDLLGVPRADHPKLRRWREDVVHRDADAMGLTAAGQRAFDESHAYMDDFVRLRRREPADDLVSAIIAAEEAGARLTDEEIAVTSLTVLAAAFQSTNYLIGNALSHLERHPDQRALLQADPALMEGAVEEVLRYDPSTQGFARSLTTDVRLHGVRMRTGDRVLLLLASANRDERVFTNPDTFDIRRPPGRHLAFGAGIHFCVGAALGRRQTQLALDALFQRFPDYVLTDLEGPRVHSPTFRGLLHLPARLTASRPDLTTT